MPLFSIPYINWKNISAPKPTPQNKGYSNNMSKKPQAPSDLLARRK